VIVITKMEKKYLSVDQALPILKLVYGKDNHYSITNPLFPLDTIKRLLCVTK